MSIKVFATSIIFTIIFSGTFLGCIGDDIVFDEVVETIRITNAPDTLALHSEYLFEYLYLDKTGTNGQLTNVQWQSSDPEVIQISQDGNANALQSGSATIEVTAMVGGVELIDQVEVVVGESTILNNDGKSGTIKTTSSYVLEGSFILEQTGNDLTLQIADDYRASSSLPGLVLYLTNNPNTIDGSLEISPVTVFNGAHEYLIENVDIEEYGYLLYFCKPFRVKVGDGKIND